MVRNSIIAVIPARGGSKRIPHKNIRIIGGKPMIVWTIEAALNSNLFDRVIVSTDDTEIAEVSRAHGASVPFLRDAALDDYAPVSSATIRALEQVEELLGESYDVVVQLMANCPLRTASIIQAAVAEFTESQADFQVCFFEAPLVIPWWAARLDSHRRPQPLFPEAVQKRSQDLDVLFFPTGAVWVAKSEKLRVAGTFHEPGRRAFVLPWQAAVDIDTEADFELAELLFQQRCTAQQ
jgi:N-acylneuraminate cytidylyltransferase